MNRGVPVANALSALGKNLTGGKGADFPRSAHEAPAAWQR